MRKNEPALHEAGGSFWRSFNSLLILFEAITKFSCVSQSSPKLKPNSNIYINYNKPPQKKNQNYSPQKIIETQRMTTNPHS